MAGTVTTLPVKKRVASCDQAGLQSSRDSQAGGAEAPNPVANEDAWGTKVHWRTRFRAEVRNRGVLKVGTVYLGTTWLVIVVGRTLFDVFDLPHLPLQLVAVLLLLGLPVALAVAWYYRPVERADSSEAARDGTGHNIAKTAAVCVALMAVLVAIGLRIFDTGTAGHSAKIADDPQATTAATGGLAAAGIAPGAGAPVESPAFTPPAHSIAVLPFVNMSGDSKDDYFSEGLSEELLNSLSRVEALHVAARTSSFSFKGKDLDIPTIAHRLNVAAVLEGSVRREGHRVRITAQLINAVTDYHLWSRTYDRDLKDTLTVQTEIAEAVSNALQVTLLSDATPKFDLGGTRNPQALDAYLRGMKLNYQGDEASRRAALIAADEAIRADPNFALAYVLRAQGLGILAGGFINGLAERHATFIQARAAADKAISLAPELGEAHAILGGILATGFFDFSGASAEYGRALTLAPGSAVVQAKYAQSTALMGVSGAAIEAARRAVALDALNPVVYDVLGRALYLARRYEDSIAAYQRALALRDNKSGADATWIGLSDLALGRAEAARASCSQNGDHWEALACLATAYHALSRQTDAAAEMAKLRAKWGNLAAFQYAQINAQWGRNDEALRWLATAYRLHDPGLINIKTDRLLDPIRNAPEFRRIEQQLHFPQ